MVLTQDEARQLRHNYIGTEHLLLGLLREQEGLAARVLDSLGVTLDEVRARVEEIVGVGDELVTGQVPMTPRAKKVLELALRESLSFDHNYIGTEHILLALVRENEGVAAQILRDLDIGRGTIREAVARMLGGPGGQTVRSPRLAALRAVDVTPRRRDVWLLVAGWLLFAGALGLGILIGWGIWGH
jgi:ATP-dependent Clp protease ATP-binding subunit ClpC